MPPGPPLVSLSPPPTVGRARRSRDPLRPDWPSPEYRNGRTPITRAKRRRESPRRATPPPWSRSPPPQKSPVIEIRSSGPPARPHEPNGRRGGSGWLSGNSYWSLSMSLHSGRCDPARKLANSFVRTLFGGCHKPVKSAIVCAPDPMAAIETSVRATAAIDDLYRQHVGDVYRYTYAVLGNHADAEDVTQTTFVNALRALERGEEPRNAGELAPGDRAQHRAPALASGRCSPDGGRARVRRPRRLRRRRGRARRAGPRSAADPAVPARGSGDARAGRAFLSGDLRAPRPHDGGARDASVPRAPIARRGARERRHLPER